MLPYSANRWPKLKTRRIGFTLVELLVAIAILLVLTGIVVLFFPSMQEQERAARGAAMLQGWLQVAKTRALRDQAPRGLRLVNNGGFANQGQYLEQPDDFFGGLNSGMLITPDPKNLALVSFIPALPPNPPVNVDLTGGLYPVQVGDYLEVLGGGNAHQITGVTSTTLNLATPLPATIGYTYGGQFYGTYSYRIMRAPRPAGEEILQLPGDVAVYEANSRLINIDPIVTPVVLPTPYLKDGSGNINIMFAPSGAVASNQITYDTICLWVRDTTAANPLLGEPTLIGVHVRSGLIVAHPVNPSGDPFSFVRDGKSSGK